MDDCRDLVSYQRHVERVAAKWPEFRRRRDDRLRERELFGHAAERAVEGIAEDLFVYLLDWGLDQIAHQVERSDMILCRQGIKELVIETKRPLAFQSETEKRDALAQARRYADEMCLRRIAICDGEVLLAFDLTDDGLRVRSGIRLSWPEDVAAVERLADELWWLSFDGIYRDRPDARVLPYERLLHSDSDVSYSADVLRHPKYHLPAECFAYAGDASDTKTWHLPYRLVDGRADSKRLSGAIRALIGNYRGQHVDGIPASAIPATLERLCAAAEELGRLPSQNPKTADIYHQLVETMRQFAPN